MKICIHKAAEPMDINENHRARCWMNVKKGVEDGSIEIETSEGDKTNE